MIVKLGLMLVLLGFLTSSKLWSGDMVGEFLVVVMLFLPGNPVKPFSYRIEQINNPSACVARAHHLTTTPANDTVVSKATGVSKVIGNRKAWCIGPDGTLYSPNSVPRS